MSRLADLAAEALTAPAPKPKAPNPDAPSTFQGRLEQMGRMREAERAKYAPPPPPPAPRVPVPDPNVALEAENRSLEREIRQLEHRAHNAKIDGAMVEIRKDREGRNKRPLPDPELRSRAARLVAKRAGP